jgi:hypothetical protein
MSKLVFHGENADLASKLQVSVNTTAKPSPAALLFARTIIRQHGEVQEAFDASTVDREYLTTTLRSYFPAEEAHGIPDVVAYLADEHEQLGSGHTFIISHETGLPVAKLTAEDFYVPAPVPREDGRMVDRGPQIKPEILAAITLHYHDKARDTSLEDFALSRQPKGLTLGAAKRQTMVVTKAGRKSTAAQIHDQLGSLISNARGIAKELFDFFPDLPEMGDFSDVDPLWVDQLWAKTFDWVATIKRGVQDSHTSNLRFDSVSQATSSVTTSWARSLGYDLLSYASYKSARQHKMSGGGDLDKVGLYIAGPETSKQIRGRTLVVNGPEGLALYLSQPVGHLSIRDYLTENRDVHDRWTMRCTVSGTVYVDWGKISMYEVPLSEEDPVVEIVG